MINLNNSVPAALTGSNNVQFQIDGSGNVSACVSTVSSLSKKVTVAPAGGILTLDVSQGNYFFVNVNAAITSMSLINATVDGQKITILWSQDATGHTISLATNLKGATAPTTTANSFSCQTFVYNLANTNWYATSAGVTGM